MCFWFSWGNDLDLLLSQASESFCFRVLYWAFPKSIGQRILSYQLQSYTPVRPLAFASKCNWPLPSVSFACDMHEILKHSTPNLWTQKAVLCLKAEKGWHSTLKLKAFKCSKTGHQTPNFAAPAVAEPTTTYAGPTLRAVNPRGVVYPAVKVPRGVFVGTSQFNEWTCKVFHRIIIY